eukprot:scaffold1_cov402-Prasinococcus_capsulatus_cf.AAC.11
MPPARGYADTCSCLMWGRKTGYKDMDMIQQEEDFEAMRKKLPTAFQALVAKYAKKGNFFGNFMSGFNLDQYVERK